MFAGRPGLAGMAPDGGWAGGAGGGYGTPSPPGAEALLAGGGGVGADGGVGPGGGGGVGAGHAQTAARAIDYRIVSPRDGDIYELPPGVPAGYATIPLIAPAGPDGRPPRWFIAGRASNGGRWAPVPGSHVIRAEWGPDRSDSVTIVVR
jgi:hypothetical protein